MRKIELRGAVRCGTCVTLVDLVDRNAQAWVVPGWTSVIEIAGVRCSGSAQFSSRSDIDHLYVSG